MQQSTSTFPSTRGGREIRPERARGRRGRRALVLAPECAVAAGLRYGSDADAGLRRIRCGRGFRHVDALGRTVRDRATLARIRSLAIPPAWTDVWICAQANGHVQATGRDARGRKQYRYHPAWSAIRSETKFDRMIEFARALPKLRRRVAADLALPGLPRAKVLAALVRLLERSLIRVGCEEYARANAAHGLATLRDDHVRISGSKLRFEFNGKGGKQQRVVVTDRRLARVVKRCMELPGRELFQYVDDDGARQRVDSGDVNDYLREIAGDAFTAKDFRTWGGTLLAALELECEAGPDSPAQCRRRVAAALGRVSERLGNTPAVCRRYYVNPIVLEAWEAGSLRLGARGAPGETSGLDRAERALLALLERAARPLRRAA
jgi:DNA topoisomerase-1